MQPPRLPPAFSTYSSSVRKRQAARLLRTCSLPAGEETAGENDMDQGSGCSGAQESTADPTPVLRGQPHLDSDVDLLVVMPFEGSPFRQAAVILSHVVRTVGVLPMDLLVRSAEQVQERLHMGDSFMREILEHGKVLYSSTADAYEADHA